MKFCVKSVDELMQELKVRASRSKTAKHWVENLPASISNAYVY